MLDQLITTPDMFEVVLDAIAYTLASECENQRARAIFDGRDPELHAFRVFVESCSAHDQFAVRDTEPNLRLPIVNVCYNRSDLPKDKGSPSAGIGHSESKYLIDCYAYSETVVGIDGGHMRTDEASARAAYRVARQVRQILMSVEYQDLGLPPGTIGERWVDSIESMRPRVGQALNERIAVARIRFSPEFLENAPQITPFSLVQMYGAIKRDEDGQILAKITKGLPAET